MRVLWVSPYNVGPYHYAMFSAIIRYVPEFSVLRVLTWDRLRAPLWADLGLEPCPIQIVGRTESILKYLRGRHLDVMVVVGYNRVNFLLAALWARMHNMVTVLATDTWWSTSARRWWWKEKIKSILVRSLFDAAFVPGQRTAEYIKSLGIKESKIWRGLYVVDIKHFCQPCKVWEPPSGFPENFFLTVSRLSPEKNIMGLLRAFEKYHRKGGSWHLVIAAAGPMEKELKTSVPSDIADMVHWLGWVRYHELPKLYQAASCFVLSSIREPWGQVVNEAMVVGLPILLSNRCGSALDFCKEGMNGYCFDPLDVTHVADLMLLMSSARVDLNAMGMASREIISFYTPERWARTLLDCVKTLTQAQRGKFQ